VIAENERDYELSFGSRHRLGRVGQVWQLLRGKARAGMPGFAGATGAIVSSRATIAAVRLDLANTVFFSRDSMSAKVLNRSGQGAPGPASRAQDLGALRVDQPETRDQVSRLVHKLCADPNLFEDLVQEALLCYWQAEVSHPGQSASWYRQRCHLWIQDYFKKGRSVDSPKHNLCACSIGQAAEIAAAPDGDILQEICERDDFEELTRRLDPAAQQTLRLLSEGLTVREIASALHISHVAVISRRRHIAATAAGLGIHP